MRQLSFSSGATLIELIIIIVIIAILTVIAFVSAVRSIGKSRQTEAKMTLKSIYQFELAYYSEKGFFIYTSEDTVFDLPGWSKPRGMSHYWFGVRRLAQNDSISGFIAIATEKGDANFNGIPYEKIIIDEKGIFRKQ